MEGRTWTSPEQERVLAQGRSSGECERLKSDIYVSLSVWHSTSKNQLFLERTKLSEASSLTILSFTVDSSELFYLIFIFYFECLVRLQP